MSDSNIESCHSETVPDGELLMKLQECIQENRGKAGALIPVLQKAQAMIGYLPEWALKHIAFGLGRSYSEVAGVVGFYSFFSTVPRGRHIFRVCLGTACYVRGGKRILEELHRKLNVDVGGTTSDGKFSLELARCFGACGLAPAVTIDEKVYQRVRPAKLQEILDKAEGDTAHITAKDGDHE